MFWIMWIQFAQELLLLAQKVLNEFYSFCVDKNEIFKNEAILK